MHVRRIILVKRISLGGASREMVAILLILNVFCGSSLTQLKLLLLTVVITAASAATAFKYLVTTNGVCRHVVNVALVSLII